MMWLKRPIPAALILVLVWAVFRLAFIAHTGIPQPRIHDEFSYLLGADTFVHGRLTNPPPSLGQFFESPHILVRPTYASKYPPGQAMVLALGQRIFGDAFYGVLIGNALMLFTFCVMLFAWVPGRWALAVSAMFGLCLSGRMYWTYSYWGGSVAASGGALVLLGIGIYRAKQTALAGAVFALGALLLFWTRPFEGGIFTLVVLLVFAREIWTKRSLRAFFAAASIFAIGIAWTCYDNKAVTGHPLLLPYLVHQRQYDVAPVFWFQRLHTQPAYSHPRLAGEHGIGGEEVVKYEEEGPRWQSLGIGLFSTLQTFELSLGISFLLTLIVPVAWRDPVFRKMTIVAGFVLVALSLETFHAEHYSAPAWAAVALMIAIWAERAWRLRLHRYRVGVALVLLALLSPVLITLPSHFITLWAHLPGLLHRASAPSNSDGVAPVAAQGGSADAYGDWSQRRASLIQRLSALDRQQLVIVRYPYPDWRVDDEWVYNGADIDHQRVVFAHDLGQEQNVALLNYYPDRTALLLTFDPRSGQEQVEPYPNAATPASLNTAH